MRFRAEKCIVVSLAGVAAQHKFDPQSVKIYHGESDRLQAAELLNYFVGSTEELEAYLNLLQIRARRLIEQPHVWSAIEAVAQNLLLSKTLTGAKAKSIWQEAIFPSLKLFT